MRHIFTYEDRTVKKYTVRDALKQARMVLTAKNPNSMLCVDKAYRRRDEEQITLEQMSTLVDDLVLDTLYWEFGK